MVKLDWTYELIRSRWVFSCCHLDFDSNFSGIYVKKNKEKVPMWYGQTPMKMNSKQGLLPYPREWISLFVWTSSLVFAMGCSIVHVDTQSNHTISSTHTKLNKWNVREYLQLWVEFHLLWAPVRGDQKHTPTMRNCIFHIFNCISKSRSYLNRYAVLEKENKRTISVILVGVVLQWKSWPCQNLLFFFLSVGFGQHVGK